MLVHGGGFFFLSQNFMVVKTRKMPRLFSLILIASLYYVCLCFSLKCFVGFIAVFCMYNVLSLLHVFK